jgi:GxxExxY protein
MSELVGTFRADLSVECKAILELKAAEAISKAHEAQLTHSLRASSIEVGVAMNFGEVTRFRRTEFRNKRKCRFVLSALIPS